MSRRLITMVIASVFGLLTACGDGGNSTGTDTGVSSGTNTGVSTGSSGNAEPVTYASPPNKISTLPLID